MREDIMDRRWLVALTLVAAVAGAVGTGAAGLLPKDAENFLLNAGGFKPADVASLETGKVIANVFEGSIGSEVFVVAAVKVRATRDQVASYYGQMVSYVDGQVTLGFGKFSQPPVAADVAKLTLDRGDIEALRDCRPGDCDLKIGGAGIGAIRSAVNWKAADAVEQAQRAVRAQTLAYVADYMKRGDAALATYNDRAQPVSLKAQWREMVKASPYFHAYTPALEQYLLSYPAATLPGGRDVIYWVNENYGMKPVLSVVHGVIYQNPAQPDRTIVMQKQIYASHYMEGSAAVCTIVGATENGKPVSYLVYANRSRGDLLKGGFGGLKRKVAGDQARKAAAQTLETIKTVLEQAAGIK